MRAIESGAEPAAIRSFLFDFVRAHSTLLTKMEFGRFYRQQ
jgi:hypothetical protein